MTSTQLTTKQSLIALGAGGAAMLLVFYYPMVAGGRRYDVLEWCIPAIFVIGPIVLLPLAPLIFKLVWAPALGPFILLYLAAKRIRAHVRSKRITASP